MGNNLNKLACLSMLAIGAVATATAIPAASTFSVFAGAQNVYTCTALDFGEAVNPPSASATIDISEYATLTNLTDADISLSNWTNANYKTTAQGGSAIKIGGSSSGKYDGSITVTFNNYVCDKVIAYAAGWKNDPGTQNLVIAGDSQAVASTAKEAEYTFNSYTYEFDKTNTFTITNGTGNTGNRRVVISKLVFRLYN